METALAEKPQSALDAYRQRLVEVARQRADDFEPCGTVCPKCGIRIKSPGGICPKCNKRLAPAPPPDLADLADRAGVWPVYVSADLNRTRHRVFALALLEKAERLEREGEIVRHSGTVIARQEQARRLEIQALRHKGQTILFDTWDLRQKAQWHALDAQIVALRNGLHDRREDSERFLREREQLREIIATVAGGGRPLDTRVNNLLGLSSGVHGRTILRTARERLEKVEGIIAANELENPDEANRRDEREIERLQQERNRLAKSEREPGASALQADFDQAKEAANDWAVAHGFGGR